MSFSAWCWDSLSLSSKWSSGGTRSPPPPPMECNESRAPSSGILERGRARLWCLSVPPPCLELFSGFNPNLSLTPVQRWVGGKALEKNPLKGGVGASWAQRDPFVLPTLSRVSGFMGKAGRPLFIGWHCKQNEVDLGENAFQNPSQIVSRQVDGSSSIMGKRSFPAPCPVTLQGKEFSSSTAEKSLAVTVAWLLRRPTSFWRPSVGWRRKGREGERERETANEVKNPRNSKRFSQNTSRQARKAQHH